MTQINLFSLVQNFGTLRKYLRVPNLSPTQMLATLFILVIWCCLPASGLKLTTLVLLLNHCFVASIHVIWVSMATYAALKVCNCLFDGRFSGFLAWVDGKPLPPRRRAKPSNTHSYEHTSRVWNPILTIRWLRRAYNDWYPQCRDIVCGVLAFAHQLLSTAGAQPALVIQVDTRTPDLQAAAISDPEILTQAIPETRQIALRSVAPRVSETLASNRKTLNRGDFYHSILKYIANRPVFYEDNTCRLTNEVSVHNTHRLWVRARDLSNSSTVTQPLTLETGHQSGSIDVTTSESAVTDIGPLYALAVDPLPVAVPVTPMVKFQPKRKMDIGSNYLTMSFGKSRSPSLHRVEKRKMCNLVSRKHRVPGEQQGSANIDTQMPCLAQAMDLDVGDSETSGHVLSQKQPEPEMMDWEPSCPPTLDLMVEGTLAALSKLVAAGEGSASAPTPVAAPTMVPRLPKSIPTSPSSTPYNNTSKPVNEQKVSTLHGSIRQDTDKAVAFPLKPTASKTTGGQGASTLHSPINLDKGKAVPPPSEPKASSTTIVPKASTLHRPIRQDKGKAVAAPTKPKVSNAMNGQKASTIHRAVWQDNGKTVAVLKALAQQAPTPIPVAAPNSTLPASKMLPTVQTPAPPADVSSSLVTFPATSLRPVAVSTGAVSLTAAPLEHLVPTVVSTDVAAQTSGGPAAVVTLAAPPIVLPTPVSKPGKPIAAPVCATLQLPTLGVVTVPAAVTAPAAATVKAPSATTVKASTAVTITAHTAARTAPAITVTARHSPVVTVTAPAAATAPPVVTVTAPAAATAPPAVTVTAPAAATPLVATTIPVGPGRALEKREKDMLARGQHIKEPTGLEPDRLSFLRRAAETEVAKIDPTVLTEDTRSRLVVYYTQLYHLMKRQQK